MNRKIRKFFFSKRYAEVDPDEIFLDSKNLPQFDTHQFEGRLEKPISRMSFIVVGIFFLLIGFFYTGKVWGLQIKDGERYALRSESNHLKHTVIFPQRGVVYDRNNVELAWNIESGDPHFAAREYTQKKGLAHVLGYIKYPSKDKHGFYYRADYEGKDGVEKIYNDRLNGENGVRIVEVDALGAVHSESVLQPPVAGDRLVLSVNANLQNKFYLTMEELSEKVGYTGGAAIIMDIYTGEVHAAVSYPEYDSNILSEGINDKAIQVFLGDSKKPFLNRIMAGGYTPGSIIKPFIALAALNEKIIDPKKQILSTGSISVQNPYNPSLKTVFTDWKAHGLVDMRRALAVSSNVYFYVIGGGYNGQQGLGITRIADYMKKFGFGQSVENEFFRGAKGVVPTPDWKKENFDNDDWRLGDTYFTSIGQYGFQVSPLQMVRATALLANEGRLIEPTLIKGEQGSVTSTLDIPREHYAVIKEGMRQAVTEGTAAGLNVPYVKIAAKTGTAELGVNKERVNSWVEGYFPAENPRYAFVVLMERGHRTNTIGGVYVMRQMLDWMNIYAQEYFH